MDAEDAAVFRVKTRSGSYAVKSIPWTARGAAKFRWQDELMKAAEVAHLPVARVHADLTGSRVSNLTIGGVRLVVQVTEWLVGVPLADAAHTPPLLRDIGRTAGRLSNALTGLPRPSVGIDNPWDARRTTKTLQEVLPHLADRELSGLVEAVIVRFESDVSPVMSLLPSAVVHQDLHDTNLLVAVDASDRDRVVGILDFGDASIGLRVSELGVAAAYGARGSAEQWEGFMTVVAGWCSVASLSPEESAVVLPLALSRLATNAGVWSVRAGQRRDSYAAVRSRGSVAALRHLLAVPREEATVRLESVWRRAAGGTSHP